MDGGPEGGSAVGGLEIRDRFPCSLGLKSVHKPKASLPNHSSSVRLWGFCVNQRTKGCLKDHTPNIPQEIDLLCMDVPIKKAASEQEWKRKWVQATVIICPIFGC